MNVDGRFGNDAMGASAAASGFPNNVSACPAWGRATALAKSAENCGPFSLRLIQKTAPRFGAATAVLRKRTSTIVRFEKGSRGRVSRGVCMADHQTPASSSATGNAPPPRTVQSGKPSPVPSYIVGSEGNAKTQRLPMVGQAG